MTDSSSKFRVLVVGASSKVGKLLVRKLLDEDYHVVGITSKDIFHLTNSSGFEMIKIERWDKIEVGKIPSIDYVVYLASQSSAYVARENFLLDAEYNQMSFLRIFQSVFQDSYSRPRVILAGSMTQYGGVSNSSIDESFPSKSPTYYELSKNINEMYVSRFFDEDKIAGFRFLRLSNVYGFTNSVSKHRGFLDKCISAAIKEKELFFYGQGDFTRDYLHVDDLLDAIVKSLDFNDNSYNGIYNLGTGVGTTVKEALNHIARVVREEAGYPVTVKSISPPSDIYELEFRDSVTNSGLFRSHTSWSPRVDLVTGIRRSVVEQLARGR